MIRTPPLLKFRRFILPSGVGVVAALVLLTTVFMRSAQNPASLQSGDVLSSPAAVNNGASLTTAKEKAEPKKSNLEMTKTDAAELAALADKLRDELNKMNVNVLSLDVIQKTEEVEKLAKKIKGEAHEH
jgi:hypothetical protein